MRRAMLIATMGVLLGSVPQLAQEFRATITGLVMDSSGAGVPSVPVQVRNVATNEIASAATDAQGNYTVPFLRPGTYSVQVEAAGFKKFSREGLVLNVGQTAAVNVTLEVGAVTEQITVTAETPLLETTKADRGTVIDRQRVHEFPLNARNPFMLSMLVAGVQYNGTLIYQRPFDNGAIADWSVNGSQNRNNEFLLDGAPNNAQAGGNNIAYVPPVDSVQEFKIQTTSYDAQYGKTGGGIINVSLKSGTNAFHGTAYEFARRNGWDANSFQNNARGAPRSGHFLDQYGFQVEGPVYLPKLWDGRDRTFFMVNYEDYREGTPNARTLSVPEPEMLDGNFGRLVDAQGRAITIYDPGTGRDVSGVWRRDAFPGNAIPASRMNPIARRILGFMPKPNTRTAGADYSSQNLFVAGGDNVARDDFYNLVVKIDQNLGDRHRVFFRHASNDRKEMGSDNGLPRGAVGEDGPLPHWRINDAYVLDWVATLKPTFLLNLRGSFTRYIAGDNRLGNLGFDKTTLGFPASLVSQLPHGAWFGRYEFENYVPLGNHLSVNYTNTVALHPTITYIRGPHSIKAGVDMRWVQYALKNAGQPFLLRSERNFTRADYTRQDALSGNAVASWLLGAPTSGRVDYNVFPIHLHKYYAPYFQDDWKLTRRLTLNLGVRLDFNQAADERYNRLNRGFDAQAVSPVDRLIDRGRFAGTPQLRGGMLFAGVNGVSRIASDLDKVNIQPRFGLAYQLTSRLVVRSGWGRYFHNPNNADLQSNGFSQASPLIASLDGGRTGIPNVISNPFPNGVELPPGSALGLQTFLGRGFSFVNSKFQLPYVNQFSFGVQYELPGSSKIEVSYVGSRTRKLQTDWSFNEYDLAFRRQCNLMEGGNPLFCDQRLPNPFQGLAPFAGTNHFTDATLARTQLARPYPHFTGLTQVYRNDGRLWYNSLQLTYETRFRSGPNLSAAYTLSKMIEESGFNDVQNMVLRRGLYISDRPHRLVIGGVYELPFGQGKRFLATSHRFWSRLLSGWENTVIFQWQSGQPWALPGNVLYVGEAKRDNIDWSAHQVFGVNPCVARWNDNGSITMQAFSTAAGCTGYNFLITPRFAPRFTSNRDSRLRLHAAPQADVSLNKMTQITERVKVQFRAEAFNITNTYLYYNGQFNNNPESAGFGSVIPSTLAFGSASFPRHLQLAVKVLW